MKDKLIIIATIQNMLTHMKVLLAELSDRSKISAEKAGVLKGVSICLLDLHYAITGNHWAGSPKDLQLWMIQYCKDEADALGQRQLIRVN